MIQWSWLRKCKWADLPSYTLPSFNKESNETSRGKDNQMTDDSIDFESDESDDKFNYSCSWKLTKIKRTLFHFYEFVFTGLVYWSCLSLCLRRAIHLAATLLHSWFRYLRQCSNSQVNLYKDVARRQVKEIVEWEELKRLLSNQRSEHKRQWTNSVEPSNKKQLWFG